MLEKLILRNYRGFKNHELALKDLTVIVGKNNAGKTTLVEALRLLSIVVRKYKNSSYRKPPKWADLPIKEYGVAPSVKGIGINFQTIFHHYGSPPGNIMGVFSNNSSVSIYLNENEEIYAVIRDCNGKIIENRHRAKEADLPLVSIMPQVTPVQINERMLTSIYVQSSMSSRLSSLHFRNQLNLLYEEFFVEFQQVVESTWDGVRVDGLEGRDQLPSPESRLDLFIRNEGFVGEIGLMGHGLQMWLQTMWFLTYSHASKTVILDEPDVYMHPDLQRRFIRFIKNRFPQIILTTHSIEIMSEVDPNNILIVDKDQDQSVFATSLSAVQRIINNIGSVHNIHLTRLSTAQRFLMTEGKDITFLKHFQNIISPRTDIPFGSIPHMSIGGAGSWTFFAGSSMALQNAVGDDILVYCILDRDYYVDKQINDRYHEAQRFGINLHIWSQKEIENFILIPSVIHRYILKNAAKRIKIPDLEEVDSKIETLADNMYNEVFDGLSNQFRIADRERMGKSNKFARAYIEESRRYNGSILPIVSGKYLFRKLSSWLQIEFGVHINPVALIREFQRHEVHQEVVHVITSIENMDKFRS